MVTWAPGATVILGQGQTGFPHWGRWTPLPGQTSAGDAPGAPPFDDDDDEGYADRCFECCVVS